MQKGTQGHESCCQKQRKTFLSNGCCIPCFGNYCFTVGYSDVKTFFFLQYFALYIMFLTCLSLPSPQIKDWQLQTWKESSLKLEKQQPKRLAASLRFVYSLKVTYLISIVLIYQLYDVQFSKTVAIGLQLEVYQMNATAASWI